jgi:hypothetical protein
VVNPIISHPQLYHFGLKPHRDLGEEHLVYHFIRSCFVMVPTSWEIRLLEVSRFGEYKNSPFRSDRFRKPLRGWDQYEIQINLLIWWLIWWLFHCWFRSPLGESPNQYWNHQIVPLNPFIQGSQGSPCSPYSPCSPHSLGAPGQHQSWLYP